VLVSKTEVQCHSISEIGLDGYYGLDGRPSLQQSSNPKSGACIFTSNYGEASAINFRGASYDLPKAISGHNNYYIWGPSSCNGQVILTIGLSLLDDLKSYHNVTQVGIVTCVYCMNDENNLPVYLCTNPIAPPLQSGQK
jgi:hypothetical protein